MHFSSWLARFSGIEMCEAEASHTRTGPSAMDIGIHHRHPTNHHFAANKSVIDEKPKAVIIDIKLAKF